MIREVPGGCLCCAAGLPAQMAINSLLAKARPQRLLIEPTGLGHPQEIIELLQSQYYRPVIDLRATLTLVDARKIQDERYTQHDIFRQQLAVADVIVASKSDLYSAGDQESLQQYLQTSGVRAADSVAPVVVPAVQGDIPLNLLDKPNGSAPRPASTGLLNTPTSESAEPLTAVIDFPPEGFVRMTNEADGFASHAWVFRPSFTFAYEKVLTLLRAVYVTRLKAVFITDEGIIGVNHLDGVTTEMMLDETADSRIEIIIETRAELPFTESELLACLI